MRIVRLTGGVDTHADTHVAAAINDDCGLLGVESFGADRVGFAELLAWLVGVSGRVSGHVYQVLFQVGPRTKPHKGFGSDLT